MTVLRFCSYFRAIVRQYENFMDKHSGVVSQAALSLWHKAARWLRVKSVLAAKVVKNIAHSNLPEKLLVTAE